MKKIIVASKNPVKIAAAQSAFERMFPDEVFEVEGVSVASGVSEQPMSDEETLLGAKTRVENARINSPDADFWVAFEGGIEKHGEKICAFAWSAVESKERKEGSGKTGTFYLPQQVSELIHDGMDLGEADDTVFGRTDSAQQNGIIGLLTKDVSDRTSHYAYAAILALIPFKNPHLYP